MTCRRCTSPTTKTAALVETRAVGRGNPRVPDAGCSSVAATRSSLRLLLDTGVRVSELCGLELTDVDLDRESGHVTGKCSRPRLVPSGARDALDTCSAQAGVTDARPHRLRHTVVLRCLAGGRQARDPIMLPAGGRTTCSPDTRRPPPSSALTTRTGVSAWEIGCEHVTAGAARRRRGPEVSASAARLRRAAGRSLPPAATSARVPDRSGGPATPRTRRPASPQASPAHRHC